MNYRRLYEKGGLYFFTVVTEKRRPILIDHIDLLRESFQHVMTNHRFSIEAIVILPDHLHTIWRMPEESSDFSKRWMLIKRRFSSFLPDFPRSSVNKSRREKAVWQRRFWEHRIRDETDLKRHFDYIHFNPVKHGYTLTPMTWKYSSLTKWIDRGLYPENWTSIPPSEIDAGE